VFKKNRNNKIPPPNANLTSDNFQIEELPPYVFAEVNRLKENARRAGVDIIDLGMGNPDLSPPQHVVDKLVETLPKPRVHRYSSSRGIIGLRRAHANYYRRRFGVEIDEDKEVVVTLGSTEGFVNIAQAICNVGSAVLVPSPAYPIHIFGFIFAEAKVHHIPIPEGDNFHEEYLRTADEAMKKYKPVAMVVNFPSNPTSQVAHLDFYKELLTLAKRNEVFILSDLAYAEIYFNDVPPPSMLQIEGAKEWVLEFSSMSKTYSMPGWRIGFAVGNQRLISALARLKSYVDYGAFTPIQVAATAALNGPQACVDEVRAIYKSRHQALVESMGLAGWSIPLAKATMFAWAPLPQGWQNKGSLAFSTALLERAGIAVSPGIGFGEAGEGYVRVSLVENEQRIRQAARSMRKFLEESV
jgi:alanine-synthesizing transaminase